MALKNIFKPGGVTNAGGTIEFYYMPWEYIVSIPRAGEENSTVQMADFEYDDPARVWFVGWCLPQSIGAKNTGIPTTGNNDHRHLLEGVVPTDNVDYTTLFNEMHGRKFIVIRRDSNGYFKLMGSLDNPLIFTYDFDTQTEYSGTLKCYKIKFEAVVEVTQYFLNGTILLDGGSATSIGPDGTPLFHGADGATWYTGAGAPGAGTGFEKDLYLDTATGDVYRKTGVATWTYLCNIKGPAGNDGADGADGSDGSNGADGKSLQTGTGVPGGGVGNNGDSYIDLATGDYYTKAAGSWTYQMTINLFRTVPEKIFILSVFGGF